MTKKSPKHMHHRAIAASVLLLTLQTACGPRKGRLDKAAEVLQRDADHHIAGLVTSRLESEHKEQFDEAVAKLKGYIHDLGQIDNHTQDLVAIAQEASWASSMATAQLMSIRKEGAGCGTLQKATLGALVRLAQKCPTEAGFKVACNACEDSNYPVRSAAVRLVGEFAAADAAYAGRAIACLTERLDHDKERREKVQAAAIRAIEPVLTTASGELRLVLDKILHLALQSPYGYTRTEARKACLRIAKQISQSQTKRMLETTIQHLEHKSWTIREGAVEMLEFLLQEASVNRKKAIVALQRASDDTHACVRAKADEVLSRLYEAENVQLTRIITQYTLPLFATMTAAVLMANRCFRSNRN